MTITYEGKATINYINKSYDDALGNWQQAWNNSQWNPKYTTNNGWIYYEQKNYKQAIINFEMAFELDSDFILSYYSTMNSYRLIG